MTERDIHSPPHPPPSIFLSLSLSLSLSKAHRKLLVIFISMINVMCGFQAPREGGETVRSHPPWPRVPEVHVFVDQRFKTKWI